MGERFNYSFSIKPDLNDRLARLREKGVKITEILLKGIEAYEKGVGKCSREKKH